MHGRFDTDNRPTTLGEIIFSFCIGYGDELATRPGVLLNHTGELPISLAIRTNRRRMFDRLLLFKQDLDVCSSEAHNVVSAAMSNNRDDALYYLLELIKKDPQIVEKCVKALYSKVDEYYESGDDIKGALFKNVG